MADRLDVADRLAEGRPAVEHTQTYVQACHALGYQHPDLTSHPGQVRDWYDSEDGMDLRALDRDCAALRAAGAAVTEASRMQRAQVAELAAAWTGPGGESALRLLERHCDTGSTVAAELRAAAQRCESLRDNLWYLLDSKVATAIVVDDRTRMQRQAWLAAAAAVMTGAGDRSSAEEVVRQQVQPYVDEDISNDWLTTMRSTVDGVATSYDMVIDRMAAAPAVAFEFPGDLGPGWHWLQPASPSPAAIAPAGMPPGPPVESTRVDADPVPAAPSPVPAAPSSVPAAASPVPAAPLPAAAPPPDWATGLGDPSAMPAGELRGGGVGGAGGLGGLAGLAGRIIEAMEGLLGPAADDVDTGDALDEDAFDDDAFHDASHDDAFHPDDQHKADDEPESTAHEGANKVDEADQTVGDPAEAEPVATPGPTGVSPTPVEPLAPPAAAGPATGGDPAAASATGEPGPAAPKDGSTPCEIAADQLPQAGQ